jgi:glucose/arabinose dehydrogenase
MSLVIGRVLTLVAGALVLLAGAGCYAQRGHSGGGAAPPAPAGERRLDPADVALPPGYRIEVVAAGFTFPTGVALDDAGVPHVVEAGYSYGEVFTTPRLVRVGPGGERIALAEGNRNGPWNGVIFHRGSFYVAEGGQLTGGRILRVRPDGEATAIAVGLPSFGDHHTNGPAAGPDGWLYFGQGTATNSGVVGRDNFEFGWLARRRDFHDVPCADVTLSGESYETDDPAGHGRVRTGPYLPFGRPATRGQVVRGEVPCSGAVLRVRPEGGDVELVAWGLRNPFGLAFDEGGRLFATENGYDVRGSRPVWGAPDVLWEIVPRAWYGWPEHAAGDPVAGERYAPPGEPPVRRLLASMPGTPPRPAAVFGVSSSANGLDFARGARFGHAGEAFVALFGDMTPATGKLLAPVGFKVVRADPATGVVADFAVNRGDRGGPASALGSGGLERPVAARFDAAGEALYVVDFGILSVESGRPAPRPGTGVLWRIVRTEALP